MPKPVYFKTGVYCIRNLLNGKVYVGSASKGFRVRWRDHRRALRENKHYNYHLQAAWDKYGEENFEFRVLARCKPDTCLKLEQHFIDLHNSTHPKYGYNLCPIAKSVKGMKWSQESRDKITGRKFSDSHREAVRQAVTKQWASKEDKSLPEYWRNNIRRARSTPESRQRTSKATKLMWENFSEESLNTISEKLRAANVGKKASSQARLNMSIAQKKRFENPEEHLKLSRSQKGNKNRLGGNKYKEQTNAKTCKTKSRKAS